MNDAPEKGRGTTGFGRPTDRTRRNRLWQGGSVHGLSHPESKGVAVAPIRHVTPCKRPVSRQYGVFGCARHCPRPRRSSSDRDRRSISPGRPRGSASGLCLCSVRQPPGGSEVSTRPSGRRKASPRTERPSEGAPTGADRPLLRGGAVRCRVRQSGGGCVSA
jgi:hypothetical protein